MSIHHVDDNKQIWFYLIYPDLHIHLNKKKLKADWNKNEINFKELILILF